MTARPHHIHPRDWARMSWHQQARAHRAWAKALEAERCPVRVEPVIVGPYSAVDPTERTERTASLRVLIAVLARDLDEAYEAALAPHGTLTARERHRSRREEPCRACAAVRDTPHWVTDAEVQQMRDLRDQGYTLRQIADRLGRPHSTVKDHLRARSAA